MSLDDGAKSFAYSIDEGPGPLEGCAGYVGNVRLAPVNDGDKTFIEWHSAWKDSRGGVKEFCDPVYQGLLNALAAHFA